MKCWRSFEPFGKDYVRLEASWGPTEGMGYREIALFGKAGARLTFWSFTSDGKRSQGVLSDGSDIHPQAVAFEAQMPAGLARMVYWPTDDGEGFFFVVEIRIKSG